VKSHPQVAADQVTVDNEDFDFGKMDVSENGSHDFILTNRGDQPITVSLGSTSCSCTVSEIQDSTLAPGKSDQDPRYLAIQGHVGKFRQSVTLITSAPSRPEIGLTIKGEYSRQYTPTPTN